MTTKITVDASAWVRDSSEWVLWKQSVEVGDLTDVADLERRVYAAVRAKFPSAKFIDYACVTLQVPAS